jgi:ABC-type glycerol-3-phosphate transport system substrate-binding protein
MIFLLYPFLFEEKLLDVSDIAEEAGKKLKAKDHPFGFELGHGFGDSHGWLYPLLWSYGGHEVEPDGKTVVIESDETARAVDFARKFFKDTMLDDVLGWTMSATTRRGTPNKSRAPTMPNASFGSPSAISPISPR